MEKLVFTITFDERVNDHDEIKRGVNQVATGLENYSPLVLDGWPLRDSNGNVMAKVQVKYVDEPEVPLWDVPADGSIVRKIAREIGELHERGSREGENQVGGLIRSLELIMGTDEARDALGEYGIEAH